MNDKIIVTNLGALKKKYGANGLTKIRAAVKALISADKARGLQTRLIALDRASDMKKVHGSRVSAADNCQQNKKAIDAIYAALRPDYLLILGAIDVIPHQDLVNPAFGGDDVDQYAYGDIPYASQGPYSQQADKFIGPTRVVGRLPDVTGGTDAAHWGRSGQLRGAVARGERRKQLPAKGMFIRTNQRVASRTTHARVPGSVLATLHRLARKANMRTPKILSFQIVGGGTPAGAHAKKTFAAARGKLPEAGAYYVAMTAKLLPHIPAPQITAVIAKEFDGKLVSYRELHSR